MDRKELKRINAREEARTRRRRRRKKIVLIERIAVGVAFAAIVSVAGVLIYNLTPNIKLARQMKEANAYIETEAYDDAIASYEEVLKMDSSSVQAYRSMAGAYLTKEDSSSAAQILYQGWETTQDESLLQYYCTVLLNEAVADINNQNCTLDTLAKCVSALEENPNNTDAYTLLDACYERMFGAEAEQEGLFCNTEAGCGYSQFQEIMQRLFAVYDVNPKEELKAEILKFAVPDYDVVWMDMEHLQEYLDLLNKVAQIGEDSQVSQVIACINKAIDVQDFFSDAFAIFESGDFAPIKDFMNSGRYIGMRDEFMNGTMEYWEGETYIPVSRERIKFINEDGSWKFAFPNYEECGKTSNVVSIWSAKQEDAGVQRLCISFDQALEGGEEYPRIAYEVVYLYSNVKIGSDYVPQMNYRFETRTTTQDGTITEVIGDWGGEHEWTTEIQQ